jgi:hypothetical protein
MNIRQFTLQQLEDLGSLCPDMSRSIMRTCIESYDDFIKVLYLDLDDIIQRLEGNRELRQQDSEDRITIDIKDQLICLGYNASHDRKHGGHTDLLVEKRSTEGNYIWIAEAKKHHGYGYLWQGFQQLCTRYSTGNSNQKCGSILIYFYDSNAQQMIERWKEFLLSKNLLNYECNPCANKALPFFTTHNHESSGLKFQVKHIPILLYFRPQDK